MAMEGIMYCIKCGNELNTELRQPDGAVVCPVCGTIFRPRTAQTSEQSLNNYHENNQGQSDDARSSSIPPVSSHRRTENNKGRTNKKKGSGNKRPFIFLMAVAALVVFGYFFFTGKLNSFSKGTIDPNKNVIAVTPDQSLPAKAQGDEESEEKNASIYNLKLTEINMYYLEAGKNNHLCFTVNGEVGNKNIQLIQKETNKPVGFMKDDGKGEDKKAGDGIYTLGINVSGSDYGNISYVADVNGLFSNEVIVRFFQKASEENEKFIEDIFTGIRDVVQVYSDNEGYVLPINREISIQAVAAYVEDHYYSGDIAEYSIDDSGVCFREKRTGLLVMYDPKIKGELASGGGHDVVLGLPYANDPDTSTRVDPYSYRYVVDRIHEKLDVISTEYLDENAMPEVFTRIKPGQIFLWNGHGSFHYLFVQYPYLVTGQYYDVLYKISHAEDFLTGRMCVSYDILHPRICITPDYITKYCGDMSGAFIWLGSCHSGQNSYLADSFISKGASVVVGYSKSVYTMYDRAMLVTTFYYLIDNISPNTQGCTIREAILKAQEEYGSDDIQFWDIWNDGQDKPDDINDRKPAQVVLFGDQNYRVKGEAKPTLTPEPTNTPKPTAIPTSAPTAAPSINFSSFSLTGTWKSVGSYGFGQAQPGALITFDGTYCNFYSPRDTYALYQNNGKLTFDVTSFLFRENLSFEVQVIDNNHINIIADPSHITELIRVSQ